MPPDRATLGNDAIPFRALSRRALLRRGASCAAGAFVSLAALPLLSCGGPGDDATRARELARQMMGIFEDRGRLASLGREYLATTPEEASELALVSNLTEGWTPAQRAFAPEPMYAMLREQQRADFRASRTLRVRGWVLSRTEARLSALAALSVSA
jgi:hypothetical protein